MNKQSARRRPSPPALTRRPMVRRSWGLGFSASRNRRPTIATVSARLKPVIHLSRRMSAAISASRLSYSATSSADLGGFLRRRASLDQRLSEGAQLRSQGSLQYDPRRINSSRSSRKAARRPGISIPLMIGNTCVTLSGALELRYYLTGDGQSPFESWFSDLDAAAARCGGARAARAGQHLEREKRGRGGAHRPIDWGPGYGFTSVATARRWSSCSRRHQEAPAARYRASEGAVGGPQAAAQAAGAMNGDGQWR